MRTETIVYKGVTLEIEGTYTEAENRVLYYGHLDGHPGANSSYDINAIYVADVDIIELFSSDDLEEIERIVLENIDE